MTITIDTTYLTLDELVALIEQPNQERIKRLYTENYERMQKTKGAITGTHQDWKGGYLDHMNEVGNIANLQYQLFNPLRELPFSLSDSILTLLLHDIEKPWKEELTESIEEFRKKIIKEYEIELTEEHKNALKYTHGEGNDYKKGTRIQHPLAAFIHHCDNHSARIWHDYPKIKGKW